MKSRTWLWIAAGLAGAAAARGATWAEWKTPRADAALQAEFRPGWVVEEKQKETYSSPETFLDQNRGYDGDLVLAPVAGEVIAEGPLTIHLWHAVVHPDQMNWPEEDQFETNFVPDTLPGAKVGRMVAEETWTVDAKFPVRVPVVLPRSCQSPATWRNRRPAGLFGGYEVRDAAGTEVCRGMLPARRLAEAKRSLVGIAKDDESLKQVADRSSGTVDRVGDLPDEMEAYRQVRAIWFSDPLWEKMADRKALLRRLLLTGVRISGETGLVERIQTALGTGKGGRAVAESARPGSLSSDGPMSLRRLNLIRVSREDQERCGELETSVFENEANLFAEDLSSYVTWTWAGWLVFTAGVVVILAVVFFRHKGERRVAVWRALPGWTVLCAAILWGGGKLVLDRQPRADTTEYRLAMAGWPEMHCRAVASAMTFEPGRPEWVLPADAVAVEQRYRAALDGWWAREDAWGGGGKRRMQLPRKPVGMTLELEAGWFEPAEMPVVVEDGTPSAPGRWVAATEDLDGVYALVQGQWRDLGAMKTGDRIDPQERTVLEGNHLAGLPEELNSEWANWIWHKPCSRQGEEMDPGDRVFPEHDWIVVAWKRNTEPRVFPVGDEWRKQARTIWVEQWP